MTQVDPSPAGLPVRPPEPAAPAELGAERLRQALVVHPDGTACFTFVPRPISEAIHATHRGTRWVAYPLGVAGDDNPAATSFARSMGWDGQGALTGTMVFVGDDDIEDVPGVLMAEALRRWGDLPLN